MPYVKFRKSDGQPLDQHYEWPPPPCDEATEIVLKLDDFVNPLTHKWDGKDGIKATTKADKTRVQSDQADTTWAGVLAISPLANALMKALIKNNLVTEQAVRDEYEAGDS